MKRSSPRADVRIELLDWESARPRAAPIRHAVFVEEQNVPAESEIDAWDPRCVHALACDAARHGGGHRPAAARRSHRPHGGAEGRLATSASAARC